MLVDLSCPSLSTSSTDLRIKILRQEIPCNLLCVVFPQDKDGHLQNGMAYLDFGDPQRLLRLQPHNLFYASSLTTTFPKSLAICGHGSVFALMVDRADAVLKTTLFSSAWTDDEEDASSHPIGWGLYLALRTSENVTIPPKGFVESFSFEIEGETTIRAYLSVRIS